MAGHDPTRPSSTRAGSTDVLADTKVRYGKVPAASQAQPDDTTEVEGAPDD